MPQIKIWKLTALSLSNLSTKDEILKTVKVGFFHYFEIVHTLA